MSLRVDDLDWFAPIAVSRHALDRYRERIGPPPDTDIIRGEIRCSIISARVSNRQPNWTRGIGWSGPREEHVLYIWDKRATLCWVVARPILAGPIVVKSVLAERERDIEHAMSRLIRPGMAHA